MHNVAKFTEQDEKVKTTHKQERPARLISDKKDRVKLQKFMSTCIQHFDTSAEELCNIYTGETCTIAQKITYGFGYIYWRNPWGKTSFFMQYIEKTDVNKFYEIAFEFMLEFQKGLPEGFHSRLSSRVIAMVKGKRTKK